MCFLIIVIVGFLLFFGCCCYFERCFVGIEGCFGKKRVLVVNCFGLLWYCCFWEKDLFLLFFIFGIICGFLSSFSINLRIFWYFVPLFSSTSTYLSDTVKECLNSHLQQIIIIIVVIVIRVITIVGLGCLIIMCFCFDYVGGL